jgi:hypothetical protein
MPRVRVELTIPMFLRAKTFHTSDSAATVIDPYFTYLDIILSLYILNYLKSI